MGNRGVVPQIGAPCRGEWRMVIIASAVTSFERSLDGESTPKALKIHTVPSISKRKVAISKELSLSG